MSVLDRVLASSGLYEASRRLIGAHREMERLIGEVVQPHPGQRLLDFGCGNGRLVPYLPGITYIGVDNNESYITDASTRLGGPFVTFRCGDLLNLGALDIEPVDIVVSLGVLHHLDDVVAETAVASALQMLRPGGRLVTMDPCFEPSQHSVARVLMAMDRGRFVRHPDEYRRLIERSGGEVTDSVVWKGGVYRFPYTHYVQQVVPATTPVSADLTTGHAQVGSADQ